MQPGLELIRGLHNLRDAQRGCVITIGNFDGVHRGHQALIARTRELAHAHGVPSCVLTFEPTPREFFSQVPVGRISSFRERLLLLDRYGVDRLIVQRFDAAFSRIEASAFIDELLLRKLGVRAVVVGDDFRFGARRTGDLELLRRAGIAQGFDVEGIGCVLAARERCSSTAVREALAVADLQRAALLLGRPFAMSGRVRHGLQLGRKLDMPTANINLVRRPALRLGIYAVRARIGERRWNGVASLGVRPTLGLTRCLLETHLFGDVGDVYGALLEVEFVRHLRDEVRFDTLDALAAQMQRDKAQAMDLLGAQPA